MILKVKKLNEDAIMPTRGSSSAAGWDLYSLPQSDPINLEGGETKLIHTGIAIEIPEGYFGAIYARSGLATKEGIRPANCVGIIDSDYRGEVMIAAHNDNSPVMHYIRNLGDNTGLMGMKDNPTAFKSIKGGERIAQLVIQKYEDIDIEEVKELSDTVRGEDGFGSTGIN